MSAQTFVSLVNTGSQAGDTALPAVQQRSPLTWLARRVGGRIKVTALTDFKSCPPQNLRLAELLSTPEVYFRLLELIGGAFVRPACSTDGHGKNHIQEAEPRTTNILSEVFCSRSIVRFEEGLFVNKREQHTGIGEVAAQQPLRFVIRREDVGLYGLAIFTLAWAVP